MNIILKRSLIIIGILISATIIGAVGVYAHWYYQVQQLPEPYRSAAERHCSPAAAGCGGCLKQVKEMSKEGTVIPSPDCPSGYTPWYPACDGGVPVCAKQRNPEP